MHNRIKLHTFFFGKNNERKGKSMIVQLIENIYQFLWGEWIHVPLPGGGSLGLSLLIILLLPAGIVFTIKMFTDPPVTRYGQSTNSKQ